MSAAIAFSHRKRASDSITASTSCGWRSHRAASAAGAIADGPPAIPSARAPASTCASR